MNTKFDNLLNELYEDYTLQSPLLLERQLLKEGAIDKIAAKFGTTPDKVISVAKKVGGVSVLVALLGLGTYFGIKNFSEPVIAKAKEVAKEVSVDDIIKQWQPGGPGTDITDPESGMPPGMGEDDAGWSGDMRNLTNPAGIPPGNPAPPIPKVTTTDLGEPPVKRVPVKGTSNLYTRPRNR